MYVIIYNQHLIGIGTLLTHLLFIESISFRVTSLMLSRDSGVHFISHFHAQMSTSEMLLHFIFSLHWPLGPVGSAIYILYFLNKFTSIIARSLFYYLLYFIHTLFIRYTTYPRTSGDLGSVPGRDLLPIWRYPKKKEIFSCFL